LTEAATVNPELRPFGDNSSRGDGEMVCQIMSSGTEKKKNEKNRDPWAAYRE